jgi:SAM-dependent methyltransferase
VSEPAFLSDTRASYDAIAVEYAEMFHDELADKPLDRALLSWFAELVIGTGSVADVGSGPGRSTAFLAGLGVDVFGVDLAPGMVELARAENPDLRFEVGSMLDLDLPDASLGGLLAMYSTIHVPRERLPDVFAEFHRVLAPGGYALVAFQARTEPGRRTEAFGRAISLDYHRRPVDEVAALMAAADLDVRARVVREPEPDLAYESTQQAYLLGRRGVD